MPYLAIVENRAEISRDGFERTGGTCGASHTTKQFGRGVVRFLHIRGGVRFEGLVGTNNFWSIVRKGRGVYIVRRDDERQGPKRPGSRTVGLPVVRDRRSGWRGIDTLKFFTVFTSHSNLDVWAWVRMPLAGFPSIDVCFSPSLIVIASTRRHR